MGRASSELTSLMQGLMGAQANDSGWPTFSGRYVEYPRFRKEWWAYRKTYHGHVRDELLCRSLKERSLASSVRVLVNDIDDLREAWNTLDTCFDRPEKYISEDCSGRFLIGSLPTWGESVRKEGVDSPPHSGRGGDTHWVSTRGKREGGGTGLLGMSFQCVNQETVRGGTISSPPQRRKRGENGKH